MAVVKIVAGHSVRYSLDGLTTLEFDDGEYYDLAPNAIRGFMERGWAELATPPGAPSAPREAAKPPPPPQPELKSEPNPQPTVTPDVVSEDERGRKKAR